METCDPPLITKKICNVIRVAFFMFQKGVSKSNKFMLDLHLMMKRGKILGKALNELMVEHHTALSCLPHDVHMSFVSPRPREYEFSCSSSPARHPFNHFHTNRSKSYYLRRQHRENRHYQNKYHHRKVPLFKEEEYVAAAAAVAAGYGGETEGTSPLVDSAGAVFWWNSPMVTEREVRITDSPFSSLRHGADEECYVDKEAEKFIESFYRELRLQKWMAAAHEAAVCLG